MDQMKKISLVSAENNPFSNKLTLGSFNVVSNFKCQFTPN